MPNIEDKIKLLRIYVKEHIKKDPWLLLDIALPVNNEHLKKSYHKLSLQFHPDKNTDTKEMNELATNVFQAISLAYEILSDPEKLREYIQNKEFKNDSYQGTPKPSDPSRSYDDFFYRMERQARAKISWAKGKVDPFIQEILSSIEPAIKSEEFSKILTNAIKESKNINNYVAIALLDYIKSRLKHIPAFHELVKNIENFISKSCDIDKLSGAIDTNTFFMNTRDFEGNTLLMKAIMSKKVEVVRKLLAKGIDLKAKNNLGQTALHLCVKNPEFFKIIFDADPSVIDLEDTLGKTPLFSAAENNISLFKEMFALLPEDLRFDAFQNKYKKLIDLTFGNTDLWNVIVTLLPLKQRIKEIMASRYTDKRNILHYAAHSPDALKYILDLLPQERRLFSLSQKDFCGCTPLYLVREQILRDPRKLQDFLSKLQPEVCIEVLQFKSSITDSILNKASSHVGLFKNIFNALSVRTDLVNLVFNPSELAKAFKSIAIEELTITISKYNKIIVPTFIQSPVNLSKFIAKLADRDAQILQGLKDDIPTIIKSLDDLTSILKDLSADARVILFTAMQNHMVSLIKTEDELKRLSDLLAPDKKRSIRDFNLLEKLFKIEKCLIGGNLDKKLKLLIQELRKEIQETLPETYDKCHEKLVNILASVDSPQVRALKQHIKKLRDDSHRFTVNKKGKADKIEAALYNTDPLDRENILNETSSSRVKVEFLRGRIFGRTNARSAVEKYKKILVEIKETDNNAIPAQANLNP